MIPYEDLVAALTACGGGGGGGGDGGIITPPVADQSPAGIWNGQAVTPNGPDVTTSFENSEITNAEGPFSIGTSPFTATFSAGIANSRGIRAFYVSGVNAWMKSRNSLPSTPC